MSERFAFPRRELRTRAARGAIVNGAFLTAVEALSLLQGLLVARLLSTQDFALYGIVSVTVVTLLQLKTVGIDEGYVQQDAADQELAFQRAFTLELILAVGFSVLILVLSPVVARVYDESELTPLMAALCYLPLALALQAPAWVFFRRMDFVRQRTLQAIGPVLTFPVTIGLVLAGLGPWALIVGAFVGNAAAATAAVRVSPYRLRLRYDREVARHYVRFTWPIFAITGVGLVMRQGQVYAFDTVIGLSGAAYITLAATFSQYADRADQIVTTTIYPAICAVRDRPASLRRIFVTSNRVTAVWALAFGAGLGLFAPDLVHHVLGAKWIPAIVLLQLLGINIALNQIGFNWMAFYRAIGNSRPQAVFALAALVSFLVVPIPLLVAYGIDGFAWGMFAVLAATAAVRWFYVHALLPDLRIGALLARVLVAPLAASVPVLVWRLADPGPRSVATSVAQLLLFIASYVGITLAQERRLARELAEYLRRPRASVAGGGSAA